MPPKKIGILAGGGALPCRITDACDKNDQAYHVVVFEGQGDPDSFASKPHDIIRLGAGGATIKCLRKNGCDYVVMAGAIRRPSVAELRPDWWGIKFFAKSGAQALGDDGLLRALINALEGEGFTIIGADDLVPELLMPQSLIADIQPNDLNKQDIEIAIKAALSLGEQDIGQAAVASKGDIIAREGAGGTDAMLRELVAISNTGGVLAKTLKPNQERRVDLPTIGPETIINAHAAGLKGVAVEAGNAFLLEFDETVAKANDLGVFLVGTDAEGHWS